MFSAGVRRRFSAFHSLAAESGVEASPHAHDYAVFWTCSTEELSEKGYSVDISLLKRSLGSVCGGLEGSDLNRIPFFASRQPSVENLALYLTRELRAALGAAAAGITGSQVTVWEADDAWASYSESWDR
jgi:6-pyruvoyl-tetrahydropterin synthase